MIKINIKENQKEGKYSIIVEGHTETQVCAGVSAIMQTASLGLQAIAQNYPNNVKFEREEF